MQWIRTTQNGPALQAALVSSDGEVLNEINLSTPSWESKFEWPNMPTMTQIDGQAYFSWLDTQTGRIRLVTIGS